VTVYCAKTGQELIEISVNLWDKGFKFKADEFFDLVDSWAIKQGWSIPRDCHHISSTHGYQLRLQTFCFRDPNKAMMFKLAWA
jgi:hypothetical protein